MTNRDRALIERRNKTIKRLEARNKKLESSMMKATHSNTTYRKNTALLRKNKSRINILKHSNATHLYHLRKIEAMRKK